MDLGTAIIFTSTVINIVYYIPQMYTIYVNKNFNLYDLPPQSMMSIVGGLNVYYAVLIKDKELMISNICGFTLATIGLLFMGYYAYWNQFAKEPHIRFSQRNIKLDAIDLEI
jgi:uncharacterized membrane protein